MAEKQEKEEAVDYSLNNPDTLTKYKTAATISHKVLDAVTGSSHCSSFCYLSQQ